jgi:hypothetical protein
MGLLDVEGRFGFGFRLRNVVCSFALADDLIELLEGGVQLVGHFSDPS